MHQKFFSARAPFVFLLILLTWLTGCKVSQPSIENGQTLSDLSGIAGSKTLIALSVPTTTSDYINMLGFQFEVSGSASVVLDLVDAAGNSLGLCSATNNCTVTRRLPIDTMIELSSDVDYEGVNLAASWGGNNEAALANGIESELVSAAAGTVLLKSFFVPYNIDEILFSGARLGGAQIEILDRYGRTVADCTSQAACLFGYRSDGLHYARIIATNDLVDAAMSVQWNAQFESTLQNGIRKSISGTAGDILIETLVLPSGVEGAALKMSDELQGTVKAVNVNTGSERSCYSPSLCVFSAYESGEYAIEIELPYDVDDAGLTVVWAGPDVSTYHKGETIFGLPTDKGNHAGSFYLPEGVSSVIFARKQFISGAPYYNDDFFLTVYDAGGYEVAGCGLSFRDCVLENLQSGVYFIDAYSYSGSGSENESFALTFEWAGDGQYSLTSGLSKTDIPVRIDRVQVESFHLSDAAESLILSIAQSSFEDPKVQLWVEILNTNGEVFERCEHRMHCPITRPPAGDYYITIAATPRSYWDESSSDSYSLSLISGSADSVTMENGSTKANLPFRVNRFHHESFYMPEDATANLLSLSGTLNNPIPYWETFSEITLWDAGGEPIISCRFDDRPCELRNPQPGLYFISTLIAGPEPTEEQLQSNSFNLNLAWE